jgi:polyisoprenyl-phosphate glycosyltransferase
MRTLGFLSVVIPCHNEEEVLPLSHRRLKAVLDGLVKGGHCERYEILLVNNGSTDKTAEVMEKLFQGDAAIRVIELRRNFGYQGSISAGLAYAKGDAVVTIDSDLQDPPEKIEEMIVFYKAGYDLVLGVRKERSTDTFFKRFFAEGYYRLLRSLGVEVVHNHGDFRLMARPLVDEFNCAPERNRFIRAMILTLDSRYAVVAYTRERRVKGATKFSASALVGLSLDGIFSFSYVPLRLASFSGFAVCALAVVGIGWALYIKVTTEVAPGWASTILPVMLLGGFQLLILGIIGEYVGRLYTEVKGRPLFSVRRELRHPD